ncbi:MAG TPA: S8 family serine peptidase [Solirubrobacteraceae bacterium]|nr:S8 family serine peptidase [Solirubrobacteraceae bacterium]
MHPLSRLLPALAAAALLLAAPAVARAADYVPGEVVVRLHASADQGDLKAVKRSTGVGRARTFAPDTRVLKIRDGESVADTVRELRARPEVATAAPNQIAHLAKFIPVDRGNSGTAQGWQALQWNFLEGAGVNAPDAWQHLLDVGRPGGRGAVVAVLDTGVAYANRGRRFRRSPDFWYGDFVRGYDFVDRDRDPSDQNGHGTHVASTIGERTNNLLGVTGLAYGARIMPVRVLDEDGAGDSVDITAGIRFAVDRGADVINLSFEFDDGLRQVRSSEIPDVLAALRYAYRKRVLVVAAAGNQARRAIAYPARSPYTMAVGATTEHACLADYSNIGYGLDIVAPGGGSDDTNDPACPPGAPDGRDIFQMTYPWASGYESTRARSSYRRFGLPSGFVGTSMASPHVAATAALVVASRVIGANPSPKRIMQRLQATAIDAGVAGHDRRYGAGRLNAAAATDPTLSG